MTPCRAFSQVILRSQGEGQGTPQVTSYLPWGCVAPSGPLLEDWTSCFTQRTSSFSPKRGKRLGHTCAVTSLPPQLPALDSERECGTLI